MCYKHALFSGNALLTTANTFTGTQTWDFGRSAVQLNTPVLMYLSAYLNNAISNTNGIIKD
jgi:hypothetical protein